MMGNNEKLTDTRRIDKLIQEIESLPPVDRVMVLKRLRSKSLIIINDWLEPNQERPCAMILSHNDRWESIDILESVRNNADSIGHPAILLAIKRWEQTVLTQYPLSRTRKQNAEQATWKAARGEFKRIAQKHLRNIGKALLKAAQNPERRVSKLRLFKEFLQRISEPADTYLKMVWNMLSENEIHYKSYGKDEDGKHYKKERTRKEKLRILKRKVAYRFVEYHFGEERLDPSPLENYRLLPNENKLKEEYLKSIEELFNPIFNFLCSEAGNRFIDKRPSWATMRNAYIKWLTGRAVSTAKQYRSEAKKHTEEAVKIDFRYLEPDRDGNNHYLIEDADPLLLPTIPCSSTTCPCQERVRRN